MADSLQKWVGRNRPPRVQITYDVEIGDAVEKKELPLVVGLLADLSGGNIQRVFYTRALASDASLLRPLLPAHAGGVGYASPVCDSFTAPRSWFLAGGEGEGADLGDDEAAPAASAPSR